MVIAARNLPLFSPTNAAAIVPNLITNTTSYRLKLPGCAFLNRTVFSPIMPNILIQMESTLPVFAITDSSRLFPTNRSLP